MFFGGQTTSRSPGRMSLATRFLTTQLFASIVASALLCATTSAQVKAAADAGTSDYQRKSSSEFQKASELDSRLVAPY